MTPAIDVAEATRGSAIRLGAEVGARALSLATAFLLVIGLGVHGFGTYATLFGVALIVAQLGDLGLQQIAAPSLSAGLLSLRDLMAVRLRLTLLLAFAALLLHLAGGALPPGVAWASGLPSFVLYAGLATTGEFLGVCLRGLRRPVHEAVLLLLLRAAPLAAVSLALQAGGGVERVVRAMALSTLPALATGAFFLLRTPGHESAARRSAPETLRMALPLAANAVLALASLRVETVTLMVLSGASASGAFAAALKIVEWLLAVAAAVNGGALPAMAREAARGGAGVRGRNAATLALLGLPAGIGLFVLAPDLPRLLGPGYEPAAMPLRILAAAVPVMFLNGVRLHALIAAGHGRWLPRLTAARLAVALVSALSLVPRFGAAGAAAGLLAAEVALLALSGRACRVIGFGVPIARPLLLAGGLSLPMAVFLGVVKGAPLLSAAMGAAIYAATLGLVFRAGWLSPLRAKDAVGPSS